MAVADEGPRTGNLSISFTHCEEATEPPTSKREILSRVATVALPSYPMGVVGLCSGFVTAALVGHHCSEAALAAVGLSGMICNVTGYSWLNGMSVAISTKSSQDWGGRNYRAVGIMLQRGYLILLALCIPLVFFWLNASRILRSLGQSSEVSDLVQLYALMRAPALVLQSAKIVVSRTLLSIGKPTALLKVTLVVAALNVTLSCLLIPRLGFVGAPITLLVCDLVDGVCAVCVLSRDCDFRKCWPGLSREALSAWGSFLCIAFPSFVLIAIDVWSWDLIGFLAGWVSEVALATQAVVPRIALLQYVIGAALRQGAMTAIGNFLGEGRPLAARRTALLLPPILSAVVGVQLSLIFLLQEPVGRLFSSDHAVLESIKELMPLCLVFSFFDALQTGLTGIVNACGKQYIGAPCVIFLYWLSGIPFGCYLAFRARLGLEGLWIGMTAAVIGHVLSYAVLIRCINWQELGQQVRERISREEAAGGRTHPSDES